MKERNLSLTARVEDVRENRRVVTPIRFSINEIKNRFDEGIDSVKSQFDVANSLLEKTDEDGCKFIWRSQIVLAEGLLDFYLHEISKYCMFQMFCGNWEKSGKYASFLIPMSKVQEALSASSSNDWFFEYLNERFSRDVFLSVESMKEQLNLVGVGFTPTMVKAFPMKNEEESIKRGKEIVQDLFKRRNEISHQNDRCHATAEQTDITKEYVENYINNIECIASSIYKIILEKDSCSELIC